MTDADVIMEDFGVIRLTRETRLRFALVEGQGMTWLAFIQELVEGAPDDLLPRPKRLLIEVRGAINYFVSGLRSGVARRS